MKFKLKMSMKIVAAIKKILISVIIRISQNKVVLLNNKCMRDSMNRIQNKDHRIETYEINKISVPCFDDKIYIQNNGYDGLSLDYQS